MFYILTYADKDGVAFDRYIYTLRGGQFILRWFNANLVGCGYAFVGLRTVIKRGFFTRLCLWLVVKKL